MVDLLRVVYLLAATVWVGGTVALVFVGVRAIRALEGEARARAMRTLGRRWRLLGWGAMAAAILGDARVDPRGARSSASSCFRMWTKWMSRRVDGVRP